MEPHELIFDFTGNIRAGAIITFQTVTIQQSVYLNATEIVFAEHNRRELLPERLCHTSEHLRSRNDMFPLFPLLGDLRNDLNVDILAFQRIHIKLDLIHEENHAELTVRIPLEIIVIAEFKDPVFP